MNRLKNLIGVLSVGCLILPPTTQAQPLVVATLSHRGLLHPLAVFVDSTFQPIYDSGEHRRGSWVRTSIADTIRVWYLISRDGYTTFSTSGDAFRFSDDDDPWWSGSVYRASDSTSFGIAFSKPSNHSFFADVPDTLQKTMQGRILSKVLTTYIGRPRETYRMGEYYYPDEVWKKALDSIEEGKFSSDNLSATIGTVRLEFGDNSIWVSDDILASVVTWGLYAPDRSWLASAVNIAQPKEFTIPDPYILLDHQGGLYVIGEEQGWDGPAWAIWEVRGRDVKFVLADY